MRTAHGTDDRDSDVTDCGSRDLKADLLVVGPVRVCDGEVWSSGAGEEVWG